MKLHQTRGNLLKFVEYYGQSFQVPINTVAIAADKDGRIHAFLNVVPIHPDKLKDMPSRKGKDSDIWGIYWNEPLAIVQQLTTHYATFSHDNEWKESLQYYSS